jgi:hypothetical protein
MKKFFKITGIIIILLLVILIVAPLIFQDEIEQKLKSTINNQVNANVEWSDLSLSLITNFPDAELGLENLSVINKAPFEGDTLFYAKNFNLEMGLLQVLNPEEISIDRIFIDEGQVNIKINEGGIANYDIQKTEVAKPSDTSSAKQSNFKLELQSYEISNSKIVYQDTDKIELKLENFNHTGQGDFSKNIFVLATHTDTKASFAYDKTAYLNQNNITLDADIEMDLDKMKFTFKENEAVVNQLPLSFGGFVQVNEDNQELDINFTTPDSDFKNLFAVVPEVYAGNLEGIDTKGSFDLNGRIFGTVDDVHIPRIDIRLQSKNAEFQYKSLPKKVEKINLDMTILNKTGIVEDTTIDLNTIDFSIEQNRFYGTAHFKDLTENLKANMTAAGKLNLSDLKKVYPIETEMNLNGMMDVDFETSFDMNSIEKKQYQNISSKGNLKLNNFVYSSAELANPYEIKTASVTFNKGLARLTNFDMKTGLTDIKAQGQLNNLIGYLFSDQDLSGNFTATSNRFVVKDFMTTSTTGEDKESTESDPKTENEESIKVPSKLDLTLDFDANEVVYDNFDLKNISGQIKIKDQKASLNTIQADLFGGKVIADGNVDTKNQTPTFGMNLRLEEINIAESITEIEMLIGFTPILKSLVGTLTTKFDFSGDLTKDLSPILTTLDGTGLANIIQAKIEPTRMPLANSLNTKLDVVDLKNLTIQDVITTFKFENGNVNVNPISFQVKDIKVNLQGKHSLNNTMDYQIMLNLPVKYLGKEAGSQLAKLTNSNLDEMKVNLPLGISGQLTAPQINLDTKSAISELTKQIVEEQKGNLIDEAVDRVGDLLGGENGKPKDSTSANNNEQIKETVQNALGGLLKKKKKNN